MDIFLLGGQDGRNNNNDDNKNNEQGILPDIVKEMRQQYGY